MAVEPKCTPTQFDMVWSLHTMTSVSNRGFHLAQALGRFYLRQGGRITFSNGMSVADLASQLGDRAAGGVDPSVISRVLSGERLFTIVQLRRFCDLLEVGTEDRWELYQLLAEARFGLEGVRLRLTLGPRTRLGREVLGSMVA